MGLIALSTIASCGLVLAADNDAEHSPQLEPMMVLETEGKNAPTEVTMNTKTIEITGAKPGINIGHYDRYNGTITYKNECPYCESKGLKGNLVYNPKKQAEGEITCTECNSDYDTYTGIEKSGFQRYKLEIINEN